MGQHTPFNYAMIQLQTTSNHGILSSKLLWAKHLHELFTALNSRFIDAVVLAVHQFAPIRIYAKTLINRCFHHLPSEFLIL
jgi:hypothetical protein